MSLAHLRNSVEWALMVALVLGTGALARAQEDSSQPQGKIVQISPDSGEKAAASEDSMQNTTLNDGQQQAQLEQPHYWLGLMGGPVTEELRAHIDIPENQGLLVRQIVPESPAAKAGLKNYDILLKANDAELHEMRDLMELVRTVGEQKGQITLEVLRKGKRESVWVTPAERPQSVAGYSAGEQNGESFGGAGGGGRPFDMFRMFGDQAGGEGGAGRPFAFRSFGPGIVLNGVPGGAGIPDGVSVSVQKQNDQPAHITVKRGKESWEIVGDDPGSLKQLPEDLRPFVGQMMGQMTPGGGMGNFNVQTMPMPTHPGVGAVTDQKLRERLEQIEKHMRQMEERFQGHDDSEHHNE